MRRHDPDAVAAPCNEMLDRAAERGGLEALVLLAEDVSLEVGDFLATLRRLLAAHDDAGLVVGAGSGGEAHGGLVVLTEWALRELRFDEDLEVPFDCAVADLCHQARARGRRVASGDLGVSRATLLRRLGDRGRLVRGTVAVRRKWADSLVAERS